MKLSTLVSLVPAGATLSSARNPHDGNANRAFGSLLSRMAEDAPAGMTPAASPGTAPTKAATAGATLAGAIVPSDHGNDEADPRQATSPAEGEPRSSASAVAPSSITDVERVTGGPSVARLLTLAARAAKPEGSGTASPTIASVAFVEPATAAMAELSRGVPADVAAQANDRGIRRGPKLDADDGSADMAAVAPAVIVGLAATTVPNAAGVTKAISGADASMLVPASASGWSTTTGAQPLSPLVANANLADIGVNGGPTLAAAGGSGSEPSLSAAASVDAAIVPSSVSVENHLGFLGGVPSTGAEAQRGVEIAGAATVATDSTETGGVRKVGHAETATVTLNPEADGASVDAADASPARPASAEGLVARNKAERLAVPIAALLVTGMDAPGTDAAGARPTIPTRAEDTLSSNVAASLAVPASATLVRGAVADVDGASPTGLVSAEGTSDSAVRLAVPSAATLVTGASRSGTDNAGASSTSTANTEDTSSWDSARITGPDTATLIPGAARAVADTTAAVGPSRLTNTKDVPSSNSVEPSAKPAMDEPSPLAIDETAAVPATALASLVVSNTPAIPPVMQQVAEGVVGLASIIVPDETGLGTQVAPARTMALQLSPAGLGTLTVRLHVVGRALDVQLEASDGRTAALIDRDRDTLSTALSGKDYQLQSLSVTTHDATMPGVSHAERGTDTASADPGSSGPSSGGPSGGRSGHQGARDAPGQAVRPSSRRADETAMERGGSSLFV